MSWDRIERHSLYNVDDHKSIQKRKNAHAKKASANRSKYQSKMSEYLDMPFNFYSLIQLGKLACKNFRRPVPDSFVRDDKTAVMAINKFLSEKARATQ